MGHTCAWGLHSEGLQAQVHVQMLVLDPNVRFSLDPLQPDISRGTSSMWLEGEHWALYPPLVAKEGMI